MASRVESDYLNHRAGCAIFSGSSIVFSKVEAASRYEVKFMKMATKEDWVGTRSHSFTR